MAGNTDENLLINKRQRTQKGQSIMDNPQKLATQSTQDEAKKSKKKHNTICVGHYYTETNTNNTNKT